MRLRIWLIALAAIASGAMFLLAPVRADAAEFKSGNDLTIAANQTVTGDLYITGDEITIAGRVTGDVVAAGRIVKITGQIGGSLQTMAQTVDIDGDVSGSVRMASGGLNVGGDVGELGGALQLGEDLVGLLRQRRLLFVGGPV